MTKAYPYYYLTTGTTYVVFCSSQEEADVKFLNEIRKMCKFDPKKVSDMVRLTCAEKPMAWKKGKLKVSEGKFVEI